MTDHQFKRNNPTDVHCAICGGTHVVFREIPDTVNRTQRLKALGNGVLPACVFPFALAIHQFLEGQDG